MHTLHIGIVAGEQSGDALGASLVAAIKAKHPDVKFTGIAGPLMQAQGCETLADMNTLAVMGIADVIPKLWSILSVRRRVLRYFLSNPPDVFIGIDAPDFNLPLEKRFKAQGIKTVHMVSPTLWAWRSNRIHGIKKAVDLMLCLFPFETAIYKAHQVPVAFIGHPAADRLVPSDPGSARAALGISSPSTAFEGKVVALLPGSRQMEIDRLAPLFLASAQRMYDEDKTLLFILPCAKPSFKTDIESLMRIGQHTFPLRLLDGRAHEALQAADVVLVTSGTATLETFLYDKPMVVVYRMSPFNWWLAKRLVKIQYCAIPNLLANKRLVPELLQEAATPEACAEAMNYWLQNPTSVDNLKHSYRELRTTLQQQASERAAELVLALCSEKPPGPTDRPPL